MTKIMKETKRNNYDKIMNRVGIHTLSGYTDKKLTKEDLTRIEDKDMMDLQNYIWMIGKSQLMNENILI